MAALNGDNVTFVNVQKSYQPGETLEVSYNLHDDLKSASRDWVGLFRVGWSSSRDYYTFEWAPTPTDKKGVVVFAGRRLPPEDKHFYQFCFVSSDGRVRGASSPFQFSTAAATKVEDLELVEVSEDSLMILQPKEMAEDVTKKANLEEELVSVKESVSKLESEREALVAKYAIIEQDGATMSEQLKTMEEKIADLEKQLQAKRDSETRLMEKLEKERALTHELTLAKSNEESQVALLHQQLGDKEATLTTLQVENQALREEIADLKQANDRSEQQKEELRAKMENEGRELNQLREIQVELMTQIGEKNAEVEQSELAMNQMREEFGEEASKLHSEKDQLLQELSIAQQNIAELLGAKKEGVVVDILANQEPPTLPATQINMVDKCAYEALQLAYENIEDCYHKSNEESRDLRVRLHDMKCKLDASNLRNAELTHRVEKCREEYEVKAKKIFVLEKQVQGRGDTSDEVTTLRAKLTEMEDNQEQITKSWESAIQELTARKEEIKLKNMKVAEMDEKVTGLEETLQLVQDEFTRFQDKHDKVVNEKTARLDEKDASMDAKLVEIADLRCTVSALSKEKGKLEHTVQQLREQMEALKKHARSSDRSCPVCHTKFPARVTQQDFERHVQGHFPA